MATMTSSAKRCLNCNKDVTSEKRMKDSSGKYWCLKCGEADRAKKGQTGVACGRCGDRYPEAKLTRFGKDKVCPACYREGTRGGGTSLGSGSGSDKARTVKMVVVLGLLAVVSVVCKFVLHLY